jgi:hypothetical protein
VSYSAGNPTHVVNPNVLTSPARRTPSAIESVIAGELQTSP